MINKNEKTAFFALEALKQAGADMAECRISENTKTEIYYESGKIGLMRTNKNISLSLKAIKDMKKGSISLNSTDEASIKEAVDTVMTTARFSKADEAEGISDIPVTETFEKGVFYPDNEGLYTLLREYLDNVKKLYPKISFDSASIEHNLSDTVYINTNNVNIKSKQGYYSFSPMFMARDGEKTSSFNYSGLGFLSTDTPLLSMGLNDRVLKETENQIDTRILNGKFTGEIIITPQCFDDFLGSISSNFLSDGVLIDNTSIFKDSLGKQVAAPKFNWSCLPLCPELACGYFVTGDGYAAKDMDLIKNGILENFVLSRYGAKKTGRSRSLNNGGNYVVGAGDKSLEEMIAGIDKGLVLNRFSGGSPSTNGDFTGVAKNSFLIENGKVTDAVSEVMVSGNLAQLLKDICEISKERVNNGDSILPWVKVKNIVISGK